MKRAELSKSGRAFCHRCHNKIKDKIPRLYDEGSCICNRCADEYIRFRFMKIRQRKRDYKFWLKRLDIERKQYEKLKVNWQNFKKKHIRWILMDKLK